MTDVTDTIKVIPQANSWVTFDAIFDCLVSGQESTEAIGETMTMTPRAVSYYIQLGEWLGLFNRMQLTALGHRYRLDEHDKTIARAAMLGHAWFADAVGDLDVALPKTLRERSSLSEATITRRVSGLSQLWNRLQ